MNAILRGIQSHLANGHAHASRAPVTATEDAFAVADDNAFDSVVARMAENLFDAVLIWTTGEQASCLPPYFAEPLTAFPDCRRVDQGQDLLHITNNQGRIASRSYPADREGKAYLVDGVARWSRAWMRAELARP
jgi:hypothetical protein